MITEDLKRNLVDYLQLVQDIAREIPAQRGTNLLTQYYALKGITNGLRAAIQGLADLQRLYAPDKISFKLLPLSETLEDYGNHRHDTSYREGTSLRDATARGAGRQNPANSQQRYNGFAITLQRLRYNATTTPL